MTRIAQLTGGGTFRYHNSKLRIRRKLPPRWQARRRDKKSPFDRRVKSGEGRERLNIFYLRRVWIACRRVNMPSKKTVEQQLVATIRELFNDGNGELEMLTHRNVRERAEKALGLDSGALKDDKWNERRQFIQNEVVCTTFFFSRFCSVSLVIKFIKRNGTPFIAFGQLKCHLTCFLYRFRNGWKKP